MEKEYLLFETNEKRLQEVKTQMDVATPITQMTDLFESWGPEYSFLGRRYDWKGNEMEIRRSNSNSNAKSQGQGVGVALHSLSLDDLLRSVRENDKQHLMQRDSGRLAWAVAWPL